MRIAICVLRGRNKEKRIKNKEQRQKNKPLPLLRGGLGRRRKVSPSGDLGGYQLLKKWI